MEERVSKREIEAEDAVSLPNKEVLSLLDVNANVDLGLDLAAPVDLAAAANLNVAAPIEASATANVLSSGAQAIGYADQQGHIDQAISGTANATAPQHATVDQTSNGGTGGAGTGNAAGGGTAGGATAGTPAGTPADVTHPATPAVGSTGAAAPSGGTTTDPVSGAVSGATGAVSGAVGSAASGATGAVGSTTGGVESLLNGGSLLDANVNIHADANLAAPIDGAVAANGNVAAPIDAAVGANVGSPNAVSEALAPQQVDISQNLDHVQAEATATQNANVQQQ